MTLPPMRCIFRLKPGWFCRRTLHIDGPCALIPRWWNWSADARAYRKRRHL